MHIEVMAGETLYPYDFVYLVDGVAMRATRETSKKDILQVVNCAEKNDPVTVIDDNAVLVVDQMFYGSIS